MLWLAFMSELSKVHPHARGENGRTKTKKRVPLGSPPRTWGKSAGRALCPRGSRFTPKHVGKITPVVVTSFPASVHPHARGENAAWRPQENMYSGSPPRTWGKFESPRIACRDNRFTPTHVGKIASKIVLIPASAIHPHARGENVIRCEERRVVLGSPPRTWGKYYMS